MTLYGHTSSHPWLHHFLQHISGFLVSTHIKTTSCKAGILFIYKHVSCDTVNTSTLLKTHIIVKGIYETTMHQNVFGNRKLHTVNNIALLFRVSTSSNCVK